MNSIIANKSGRPSTPNRQGLYAKAAKHAVAALDVLVKLLESQNENIRLGAARSILDKCLPDVKAIEADIDTKSQQPLTVLAITSSELDTQVKKLKDEGKHITTVNMGGGFIPPNVRETIGGS